MHIIQTFMCSACTYIGTWNWARPREPCANIHERIEHRLQPLIIVYSCCSKRTKETEYKIRGYDVVLNCLVLWFCLHTQTQTCIVYLFMCYELVYNSPFSKNKT